MPATSATWLIELAVTPISRASPVRASASSWWPACRSGPRAPPTTCASRPLGRRTRSAAHRHAEPRLAGRGPNAARSSEWSAPGCGVTDGSGGTPVWSYERNFMPARGRVETATGTPLRAFRRRQDQVHGGAPAVALSLDLAPELWGDAAAQPAPHPESPPL